ncbi:MAG TPA: glycosyl transferase family 2 [Actinomycetota bacterium]|nr:glycosyl transferase family 2 [Actinomycetota bacterium]
MSPGEVLPDDVRRRIDKIRRADILVGIPCFENEDTVGGVAIAVEAGLRKHFPELRAVICASDGGSSDRSRQTFMEAQVGERAEALLVPPQTPVPEKLCFQYTSIPGKGSALHAIFEVARTLGAKACAVLDADLRSITPYWIDRLLTPVVHHGYEFVAPVYARHKYDGTITNSLAYPLTTALYGMRIRQPIGGDFAFSGDLAAFYADQGMWRTDVARFGVDVWMTTAAVVEGRRICQSILGAKLHDPKDPGRHLAPMFRQVVGTLFDLAGDYADRWAKERRVVTPPTFGFRAAYSAEPIDVSIPRLTWQFVDGYVRNHELWRRVLSAESMTDVEAAVGAASESGRGLVVDARLWTTIVYDYLLAYHRADIDRDELLSSLIPLYFARVATFVEDTREDSHTEAERKVEQAVDLAVELKPYLRERWERPRLREAPASRPA